MSAENPLRSSELHWRRVYEDEVASIPVIDIADDIQIPSLPAALTEFLDASADTDCELRELGKIIEHDPGMTVGLLKCVNVSTHGSQPVRTPADALLRLGIPRARNYLMAAGIRGATMAYESRLMNHRNFWNESIRRGLFAQQTAKHFNVDPDLSFIGGLLQDFLLPILTNRFDNQYIQFLQDAACEGVTLVEWERDIFGWDHAVAAATVADKWHMPTDLLCAVLLHHRMDLTLLAADSDLFKLFPVTVSALLPDQLCQVPDGVLTLIDADSKSGIFRLDELCEVVDSELSVIAEGHDVPNCLTPLIRQRRAPSAV